MANSEQGEKILRKKLEKYLNNDIELLDDLEQTLATKDGPVRIVVIGLLKAGKSSLLNALTGHLDPEKELFSTGSIRTTIKNQFFQKQNFCFIDTPGLDATDDDDNEAWIAIKTADILLFVHNIKVSTMDAYQVNFLKELKSKYEWMIERMVVVMTNCEEFDDEIVLRISSSIGNQIQESTGYEVRQFYTSFTRYQKGILEKKTQLVEKSGMPDLLIYLFRDSTSRRISISYYRHRCSVEILQKILNSLNNRIYDYEKKIENIRSEEKNKQEEFSKDAEIFLSALRKKIAFYNARYK